MIKNKLWRLLGAVVLVLVVSSCGDDASTTADLLPSASISCGGSDCME